MAGERPQSQGALHTAEGLTKPETRVGMLTIIRKPQQSVLIFGSDTMSELVVLDIRRRRVKLGMPTNLPHRLLRSELADQSVVAGWKNDRMLVIGRKIGESIVAWGSKAPLGVVVLGIERYTVKLGIPTSSPHRVLRKELLGREANRI